MASEDTKIMRENLKKIETYCNEHFIPELKNIGCNQISARWGLMGRSYYTDKPQYEYTFTVYKTDGIFLKVGGLVLRFGKTSIHTTDIYESVFYGKDLILNWQAVKKQLEENIAAIRREKSCITAFQV